jgi:hypothetical protein
VKLNGQAAGRPESKLILAGEEGRIQDGQPAVYGTKELTGVTAECTVLMRRVPAGMMSGRGRGFNAPSRSEPVLERCGAYALRHAQRLARRESCTKRDAVEVQLAGQPPGLDSHQEDRQ